MSSPNPPQSTAFKTTQLLNKRLLTVQVLIMALVVPLAYKLADLQIIQGGELHRQATSNHIREVVDPAPRGLILDNLGRPLVRNRSTQAITVSRNALMREDVEVQNAVLGRLAKLINSTPEDIRTMIRPCGNGVASPCWNGSPYLPVPVATDVTDTQALAIQEHKELYPAVAVELQTVRDYPYQTLAAHTLGYIAPISREELATDRYAGYKQTDFIGRNGLEQVYDKQLHGTHGITKVAVNRFGAVQNVVSHGEPVSGEHLVTSMDLGVQQAVETAIVEQIEKSRLRGWPSVSAAAVVMEAKTGRVVAMASFPTYDPRVYNNGLTQAEYDELTDPKKGVPLVARAIQGTFPPASTFKIVSTAAAVNDGSAKLDGIYSCPGTLQIGRAVKQNFQAKPLGALSLHDSLVKSCDTIYYRFAMNEWYADERLVAAGKEPTEDLQKAAFDFGFGSTTGIDLPSEKAGRITTRKSKYDRWAANKDTYCSASKRGYAHVEDEARRKFLEVLAHENCVDGFNYKVTDAADQSIGQGDVAATPIQLAVAYAALVNGGKVMQPTLAKAFLSADGSSTRVVEPKVVRQMDTKPEVLKYMTNALANVPTDGTAAGAFWGYRQDKLPVGGKTGTAQVLGKEDNSWFASFGPTYDPEYVVVALVEQGSQGGRSAAPIARRIWERMYGLDGQPGVLPKDVLDRPGAGSLPCVNPDGTVRRPHECNPDRPVTRITQGQER